MTYARLTLKSQNTKLGPIPVSISSADTCPGACPLKAAGCYAKGGPLSIHWRRVTNGRASGDWQTFVDQVATLSEGTFWRHNQAGDLAGKGNQINADAMLDLVQANTGRRGFTYTHKPMHVRRNRQLVDYANLRGFTVNLSADNLQEADTLADLDIAPIVVIQDAVHGERADTMTPAGRKVATCPATYRDDVTCASCQLCQRRDRKVIVGFPVHGFQKNAARAIARKVPAP